MRFVLVIILKFKILTRIYYPQNELLTKSDAVAKIDLPKKLMSTVSQEAKEELEVFMFQGFPCFRVLQCTCSLKVYLVSFQMVTTLQMFQFLWYFL